MKKEFTAAYLALAAICIIWGTTYLVLRIVVQQFPPFLFVMIRQLIAGGILAAFMIWMKGGMPGKAYLMRQAVAGFLMITLGNGLVAWAEMYVPSGVAAILCSLMPMVVILINVAVNRDERPTVPILVGVVLGLAGILMIFGEHLSEFTQRQYQWSILLIFIAVLSWASGSVWLKKQGNDGDPFMNAGLQMFFGGLWLLPATLFFDDLSHVTWSAEAVYAMIYLILFGSIVAYACYTYALRKLPMTIVSLYAYVNPLVAVVLGWLVLGEKLNAQIGIAILITVAGIYIVNRGYLFARLWKQQLTR